MNTLKKFNYNVLFFKHDSYLLFIDDFMKLVIMWNDLNIAIAMIWKVDVYFSVTKSFLGHEWFCDYSQCRLFESRKKTKKVCFIIWTGGWTDVPTIRKFMFSPKFLEKSRFIPLYNKYVRYRYCIISIKDCSLRTYVNSCTRKSVIHLSSLSFCGWILCRTTQIETTQSKV